MRELSIKNERFYDALTGMLQGPAAVFNSNFYSYGQTSEGRYFKVTDYPGIFLSPSVRYREERREALEQGRAWLTLQEGSGAELFESDEHLTGPEYNIVRLGSIATTRIGADIADMVRAALPIEPSPGMPVVYATEGTTGRKAIPDFSHVPFLADVFTYVTGREG